MKFRIEDPVEREKALKTFWEERIAEEERREKIVTSEGYATWLYKYVMERKHITDQDEIYTQSSIENAENVGLLSVFMNYAMQLDKKQQTKVYTSDNPKFPSEEEITVRVKDEYFRFWRLHGQGTKVLVKLLTDEPKKCVTIYVH